MDESYYYHSIAIAARGSYSTLKKCHAAGGGSWEAAYFAAKENGMPGENSGALPHPEEAYQRMTSLNIRLILLGDTKYPTALRHISHPPFGLYIKGRALAGEVCNVTTIAIVGTRRASVEGKMTARTFACELANAGCAIASGLAFGIDGAAHEGALDAGGTTIAVLAGGLDDIYPHSHNSLARRMLENGGTLVSEYPPGEEAFGYRFIERNRIISGISRGVLIVEAPESSGAMATARYAADQNRELFVVPGSISMGNFKGSHALIRQGAELVTSPDDILDAYGISKKENMAALKTGSSPEEILILKALTGIGSIVDVDKLVTLTRLEPPIVNQTLSFLLMRGIVKESEEGYTI